MPNQENRTPGQRAYNVEAERQAELEAQDKTKHVGPHTITQGGVEVSAEDVERGADTHAAPSAPRTMDQPPRRDALPTTPSGDDVPGPTAPGYGGARVPVGPLPVASPATGPGLPVAPAAPAVPAAQPAPGDTRKTTRR